MTDSPRLGWGRNGERSHAGRILDYLDTHPGWHTPVEVAVATRIDTSSTARVLIRLSVGNHVMRHKTKANGPGASRYALHTT